MTSCLRNKPQCRGSALLAVLWLSIAMSAIAFALSRSVRTELERAALHVDSTRAYYLAQGAIERAMLHLSVPGGARPEDSTVAVRPGQSFVRFRFPAGTADVEIQAETGKINVNRATADVLARLLVACRLESSLAVTVASRIVEARRRGFHREPASTSRNLIADRSFSNAGASFRELEELLMVPGVSPGILFGAYRQDAQSGLMHTGGLFRHLTTTLMAGAVNLNYASREVLLAAGVPAPLAESIIALRKQRPLVPDDEVVSGLLGERGGIRLGLGGFSQFYTLRATARVKSDRAVRTLAALVQMAPSMQGAPVRVVRWYDLDF